MKTFFVKHGLTMFLIILGLLVFDQFMRRDAENLCSNEATAYPECSDR